MDPSTCSALALCLIYEQPPGRVAGLYLLEPAGDVRLLRHPQAGDPEVRAELHLQGADLCLLIPDSFMSSQHAVLRRDGKGLLRAEDLGSKNGTRLCGVPLRHGSRPLRHGDELEAGRTLLRLLTVDSPSRGRREDDLRDRVFAEEPLRGVPGWPGTLSPTLRRVLGVASRLPGAEVPVLIQGEPGTGKRALAAHLHDRYVAVGGRGPLLAVPPGGRLPLRELHGGTLLIEDVGRLTQGDQLDLLRLLRGELRGRRMGPVQLIATTDIDLGVLARGAAFRPDLLVHLSAVTLTLPPLRERKEDLGLLTEYYLGRLAGDAGEAPAAVSADAWRRIHAHEWPGNQSELRATLKQALARMRLMARVTLEAGDLPETIQHGFSDPALPGLGPPLPWVPVVAEGNSPSALPQPGEREARKEALVQALHAENGKVARAARRLGLSRVHVHRLARQLGINLDEFRVRRTTRKI